MRFQYHVFITHAHDPDRAFAKVLCRDLRRLGVPLFCCSAMRVFLDQEAMPGHPDVSKAQADLAARSRYLMILGSPGARMSPNVDLEIRSWANRPVQRRRRCLLVRTAGELISHDGGLDAVRSTALPEAARPLFATTPIWVDLGPFRSRSQRYRFWLFRRDSYRRELARLVGPIRHVAPDRIVDADAAAVRFTGIVVLSLVAALVAALAVLVLAIGQRNEEAERARIRRHLQVAERSLSQDAEMALRIIWTAGDGGPTTEVRDALVRALLRTSRLPRIPAHEQPIRSLCFDAAGERLLSASSDGTARVWDIATSQGIAMLRGHGAALQAAQMDDTGHWAHTTGDDGRVCLWSVQEQRLEQRFPMSLGVTDPRARFEHGGQIVSLLTGPSRRRSWRVSDGSEVKSEPSATDAPEEHLLASRGALEALLRRDGTVRIRDGVGRRELVTLRDPERPVSHVAFRPDGSSVLTCAGRSEAILWATRTGTILGRIHSPGQPIHAAEFTADGRLVVTRAGIRPSVRSSGYFAIEVWQVRDLSRWMSVRHPMFDATVFAVDPAGRWLAMAAHSGEIVLVPLDPVAFLRAHPPRPLSRLELLHTGLLEGR